MEYASECECKRELEYECEYEFAVHLTRRGLHTALRAQHRSFTVLLAQRGKFAALLARHGLFPGSLIAGITRFHTAPGHGFFPALLAQ